MESPPDADARDEDRDRKLALALELIDDFIKSLSQFCTLEMLPGKITQHFSRLHWKVHQMPDDVDEDKPTWTNLGGPMTREFKVQGHTVRIEYAYGIDFKGKTSIPPSIRFKIF